MLCSQGGDKGLQFHVKSNNVNFGSKNRDNSDLSQVYLLVSVTTNDTTFQISTTMRIENLSTKSNLSSWQSLSYLISCVFQRAHEEIKECQIIHVPALETSYSWSWDNTRRIVKRSWAIEMYLPTKDHLIWIVSIGPCLRYGAHSIVPLNNLLRKLLWNKPFICAFCSPMILQLFCLLCWSMTPTAMVTLGAPKSTQRWILNRNYKRWTNRIINVKLTVIDHGGQEVHSYMKHCLSG